MFETAACKIGDQPCIDDYLHITGNTSTLTFQQVHSMIQTCATTLQHHYHLAPNECVAMFSENSYKWLVADQAIMTVR
jgi:long-subunit acyl-CoA synthetase (AMP-forming)